MSNQLKEKAEAEDKVPCVVCKELIQPGAKVCFQCDRSQNWWTRHLKGWAVIAGALVAVLSLVSSAQSLRTLIPTPAALKISTMTCAVDSIQIAVTNLGDRPGILRKLSIEVMADDNEMDSVKSLALTMGSPLVEGGKTNVVHYVKKIANKVDELPKKPRSASTCVYKLTANMIDFEKNTQTTILACPCPE